MSETLAKPASDGSGPADAAELFVIDVLRHPWRIGCPEGHTDFAPTNSHIWCRTCANNARQGEDVDPEHWNVLDRKTGETHPWSAVEIVGDE